MLEEPRVRRLRKRLEARNALGLTTRDLSILHAARQGHVLIEAFHRYTSGNCQRVEYKTVFGVAPTDEVRLRQVKNKPGYKK